MHKDGNTIRKHAADNMPKLRQASAKAPSLKECLFSKQYNPAIEVLKKISFWFMFNWPDFMGMEGWRKWLRRVITVAMLLGFLGLSWEEGFYLPNVFLRGSFMTLFAASLYGNYLGFAVQGVLQKWEALA